MAVMDNVTLIKQNIEKWNRWRLEQANEPISFAGQDLSYGYFFEGDFSGLDLRGANLERACLIGADFSNADLRGANLSAAYLSDANFSGAYIAQANLTGAQLDRVDLTLAISTEKPSVQAVPERQKAESLERKTAEELSLEQQLEKQQKQFPSAQNTLGGNDPAVRIAMAKLVRRPTAHSQRLWSMVATR